MYATRGFARKANELAREELEIARRINDPTRIAIAQFALASNLTTLGDLTQSRQMLEESIELSRSLPDALNLQAFRTNLPANLGRTLWLLGFPDLSLKQAREAEIRGHRSSNPFAKAIGLAAKETDIWAGNFESVRVSAQTLLEAPWAVEISPIHSARADLTRGWLLAKEGKLEGIAMIRDAMARRTSSRFGVNRSLYGAMLAEACASVGQINEALSAVDEVLPFAQTEERYYEAELTRLRGELLLQQDASNGAQAEQSFRTAIEIARSQKAKSWELRATTSLARLLGKHGKHDEGRAMLSEIYNWFTERFDTADLKDAKALLDELSA